MSEREVRPWPARVRYPLIAALVVFGVAALTMALLDGVDGAVVRILVAAVVIPALLVPLQLVGLRRRSTRLAGGMDAELADLAARIRGEQALARPDRPSGASDDALAGTLSWVEATRHQLVARESAGAARSVAELPQLTTGWAADAPLTQAVARCVRSARNLGKVADRADGDDGADR